MYGLKYLRIFVAMIFLSATTHAWATAGDTAVATLAISGNVPAIFTLYVRGQPGELDLGPKSKVIDRLIGIFHFKYNENVASLTLASSTASGSPDDGGGTPKTPNFDAGTPFKLKFAAGCKSVDLAAYGVYFDLSGGAVDIKSTVAADLTTNTPVGGIEEDCKLVTKYSIDQTAGAKLPLAGYYSMTLTLTMVSSN